MAAAAAAAVEPSAASSSAAASIEEAYEEDMGLDMEVTVEQLQPGGDLCASSAPTADCAATASAWTARTTGRTCSRG